MPKNWEIFNFEQLPKHILRVFPSLGGKFYGVRPLWFLALQLYHVCSYNALITKLKQHCDFQYHEHGLGTSYKYYIIFLLFYGGPLSPPPPLPSPPLPSPPLPSPPLPPPLPSPPLPSPPLPPPS